MNKNSHVYHQEDPPDREQRDQETVQTELVLRQVLQLLCQRL